MVEVLYGEDALELWRQGKDAWNAWIEDNPGVDINFSYVDFRKERRGDTKISFKGFKFGNGTISFKGAKFGDGGVSFTETHFGRGRISFDEAQFGNGDITFYNTHFGDKDSIHREEPFEEIKISFIGTKFCNGDINFDASIFFNTCIYFKDIQFGNTCITYSSSIILNTIMVFKNCRVKDGIINFNGLNIKKSSLIFSCNKFKDVDLSFGVIDIIDSHIKFDNLFTNGSFIISACSTLNTEISLESINIGGNFSFSLTNKFNNKDNIQDKTLIPMPISAFSLKKASFGSSVSLNGNFDCIPDLRMSKISHHIDLLEVTVNLKRKGSLITNKTAEDKEDYARLRRLKELAESAKDHTSALRFSADENRAARWIHRNFLQSILDIFFSLTSNYGQSILRPFCGLTLALAVAASILWIYAPETAQARLLNSFLLSAAHTFSFLPSTKGIMEASTKVLFENGPPLWASALGLIESLLGFIFLFLIGLGLRNRFRL